mmetsp:Transcript_44637/g.135375  ORF Transcript_44637/g.135375 Transcript_44637/m.135375 type:complete len:212 (-) Transcript_44637:212-847(-)
MRAWRSVARHGRGARHGGPAGRSARHRVEDVGHQGGEAEQLAVEHLVLGDAVDVRVHDRRQLGLGVWRRQRAAEGDRLLLLRGALGQVHEGLQVGADLHAAGAVQVRVVRHDLGPLLRRRQDLAERLFHGLERDDGWCAGLVHRQGVEHDVPPCHLGLRAEEHRRGGVRARDLLHAGVPAGLRGHFRGPQVPVGHGGDPLGDRLRGLQERR